MIDLINTLYAWSAEHYVLATIIYSLLLFYGFVMYATIERTWDKALFGVKVLYSPILIIFAPMDFIYDAIVGTIIYLELPGWFADSPRLTFSKRCEFHMDDKDFRGGIARAWCFLLNTIIPEHCQSKVKK
jgi:hypothetical protein